MSLLPLIFVSGVNDHAVFVSSKFFKSVPLWLVKHQYCGCSNPIILQFLEHPPTNFLIFPPFSVGLVL